MMSNDSFATIEDSAHYLRVESGKLLSYQTSFLNSFRSIEHFLTKKQLDDLFHDKLIFDRLLRSGDEKRFIQAACELTVVSHFAKVSSSTFVYEPALREGNKKNVECQVKVADFTYNIEVKCPTFDAIEAQNLSKNILLHTPVRLEGSDRAFVEQMQQMLNQAIKPPGSDLPEYINPKRMDNTLKDFLKSAGEKFLLNEDGSIVNVLVVCCDGANSIQEFFNYLFLRGGFFNENPNESILPISEYENVDVVVLCNLYYRHNKYFTKENIDEHFQFKNSFNLIFDNLNRRYKEEKIDAVDYLIYKILPNHTFGLIEFRDNDENWREGLAVDLREYFLIRSYLSTPGILPYKYF